MFWQKFDTHSMHFKHAKGDQLDDHAKHARHLHCDPHNHQTCPVFALALYLTCCFYTPQHIGNRPFPGKDQCKRFGTLLGRVLKEHETEVKELGCELSDIGMHSIRKGTSSFPSSLPGGPSAAAICLRAGWTMGKVKDTCIKCAESGDTFVGRCLTSLNIPSPNLAVSPPHFVSTVPQAWLHQCRKEAFSMMEAHVTGFERTLTMCLARLVHGRVAVLALDDHHVARKCSLFMDPSKVEPCLEHLKLCHPWEDIEGDDSPAQISGVPPHVAILNNAQEMLVQQKKTSTEVIDGVNHSLDRCGTDGGRMTEERVRTLMQEALANVE